jgi:hypothetical protein
MTPAQQQMPPGGWKPPDPVQEALRLARECLHEQQETIEDLVRCLCHKCCCDEDRDRDEGDRDRRRGRRDRDREDRD